MSSITRRHLIAGLASSGITASSHAAILSSAQSAISPGQQAAFYDILRTPDNVTGFCGLDEMQELKRSGTQWSGKGLSVRTTPSHDQLSITIKASTALPTHIHLRWSAAVQPETLVLGDAWERSYGDLGWRCLVPERVLPWYFLTLQENSLHGYGVRTGGAALCFWQLDPKGISLWLDVRNGGSSVALGDRELLAATIVIRQAERGEDPLTSARAFCRTMCEAPRQPVTIYGSNDWYYAYGHNTAEQIVRDADMMASLAPSRADRPFTVIDDGWKNRKAFPDMAALASEIRHREVRPGLWIRPLQAGADTPPALLLPDARYGEHAGRRTGRAFDPTIPDALEQVLAKVRQARDWGYELIKHDFSTYELLGQWGFEMQAQPTQPGWSLHDRSKTNAEVIRDLYRAIRKAAGDKTLLIGCNTIGHLGAGIFDAQRTGDDVSGKLWERTRRMGVNTLAFRLPQHQAFFAVDADCVPITRDTPWSCNRQWLDLVARSGTVLLVSPEPAAMGAEQRSAVREAFRIAASRPVASALDWQDETTPSEWRFHPGAEKSYNWYQDTGAWPFGI